MCCCLPIAAKQHYARVQGGGVRINNDKVEDEGRVLEESDLLDGRLCLLATGKKNKLLLRIH